MDVRLNLLNNIRDGYKRHVGNFLNVDGSFSVFKWATTGKNSLDTDGDRPSFTFASQTSLSGELWTGSGLDINQYWEQRDACDQSNLLVGCFNNEYASSWLTGRLSKRCLIFIGRSFWKPLKAFSARVLFRVEELRLVVPTENSVFADLSTINRAIGWLVDERHILPSKLGIHGYNRFNLNLDGALGSPWIPV